MGSCLSFEDPPEITRSKLKAALGVQRELAELIQLSKMHEKILELSVYSLDRLRAGLAQAAVSKGDLYMGVKLVDLKKQFQEAMRRACLTTLPPREMLQLNYDRVAKRIAELRAKLGESPQPEGSTASAAVEPSAESSVAASASF